MRYNTVSSSKPTDGNNNATYIKPLRELYDEMKQANATYIREQFGFVHACILKL